MVIVATASGGNGEDGFDPDDEADCNDGGDDDLVLGGEVVAMTMTR